MMSKSNVFDVVKRGRGALPTSDNELIVAIGGLMAIGYVSGKAIGNILVWVQEYGKKNVKTRRFKRFSMR